MSDVNLADAKGQSRKPIDPRRPAGANRRMPIQREPARDFIRRLREEDRY